MDQVCSVPMDRVQMDQVYSVQMDQEHQVPSHALYPSLATQGGRIYGIAKTHI